LSPQRAQGSHPPTYGGGDGARTITGDGLNNTDRTNVAFEAAGRATAQPAQHGRLARQMQQHHPPTLT